MSLTIRQRDGQFIILDGTGAVVDGPHRYLAMAVRRRDKIERDARKAGRSARACLCCRRPFQSEGPHNRLCDLCRHKDGSRIVGDPGGRVATSRSRA